MMMGKKQTKDAAIWTVRRCEVATGTGKWLGDAETQSEAKRTVDTHNRQIRSERRKFSKERQELCAERNKLQSKVNELEGDPVSVSNSGRVTPSMADQLESSKQKINSLEADLSSARAVVKDLSAKVFELKDQADLIRKLELKLDEQEEEIANVCTVRDEFKEIILEAITR
jgi:chromosome segregation ATPase